MIGIGYRIAKLYSQALNVSPSIRSSAALLNGRFLKQEQWERWRKKQELVSGSKHRGHLREVPGTATGKILRLYMQNPAI